MHAELECSSQLKTTQSSTFPDTTAVQVGNLRPNPWNPCNPWFSKAWTSVSPRIARIPRIGIGPVLGWTACRSIHRLSAEPGCFVLLLLVVCFLVPLANLAAAPVVITSNLTISETDTTYDGADLAIPGTFTMAINSSDAYNSLRLEDPDRSNS